MYGFGFENSRLLPKIGGQTFQQIVKKYSLLHAWNTLASGGLDIVGTTTTFNDLGTIGGKNVVNPAAVNQPTFSTPFLVFDGTTDYLLDSNSFRNADTTGVFTIKFKAIDNTLDNANRLVAISKSGINTFFQIIYRNLKLRLQLILSGVNQYIIDSDVDVVLNSTNVISVWQNGTTVKFMINGSVVTTTTITGTNDSRWLSMLSGVHTPDRLTFGNLIALTTTYGKSGIETVCYNAYTNETDILNLQNDL